MADPKATLKVNWPNETSECTAGRGERREKLPETCLSGSSVVVSIIVIAMLTLIICPTEHALNADVLRVKSTLQRSILLQTHVSGVFGGILYLPFVCVIWVLLFYVCLRF